MIQIVEIFYYIYLVLILISPVIFGVTAYMHIKKKGTERRRKVFLFLSIFLLLLDTYHLIGSNHQRKQWDEMEKNEDKQ